jgi:tetratricopeptide (TPR) repeat protein
MIVKVLPLPHVKVKVHLVPHRMMLEVMLGILFIVFAFGGSLGIRQGWMYWTRGKALAKGNELLDKRRYPEAVEALGKAIAMNPKWSKAYHLRALAYIRMGENEPAAADLSKVIELEPRRIAAYQLRANAYVGLAKPLLAIKDLETALRLSPQWISGYTLRGRAYREIGNIKASLEDLDMAVALQPDGENYYQRGLTKEALGQFERAIDDYTIAIEIDPRADEPYRARARARTELGDSSGAEQDLRRVAERSP